VKQSDSVAQYFCKILLPLFHLPMFWLQGSNQGLANQINKYYTLLLYFSAFSAKDDQVLVAEEVQKLRSNKGSQLMPRSVCQQDFPGSQEGWFPQASN